MLPWTGNRELLLQGRILFSVETFAEFETRLMRPKFDPNVTRELRQAILRDFGAVAEWIVIAEAVNYSRDPDDDKFIHTARTGRADILVSGDTDLTDL